VRLRLMRAIFALGGKEPCTEEARLNWDGTLGVVIAFATLIGSAFLAEPVASPRVIAKIVICALVVITSVIFVFQRRAILIATCCFIAMR
jgi:hypothetical protein